MAFKTTIHLVIEATDPTDFYDAIGLDGTITVMCADVNAVHKVAQEYHQLSQKVKDTHPAPPANSATQ